MDAQQVADAIRQTGRKAAAKRMHATEYDCLNAADTIERLTKERDHFKNAYGRLSYGIKQVRDKNLEVIEQRDEARAEVERLKAEEATLIRQVQQEAGLATDRLAELERMKKG
jgi:archaellum component FlaC